MDELGDLAACQVIAAGAVQADRPLRRDTLAALSCTYLEGFKQPGKPIRVAKVKPPLDPKCSLVAATHDGNICTHCRCRHRWRQVRDCGVQQV